MPITKEQILKEFPNLASDLPDFLEVRSDSAIDAVAKEAGDIAHDLWSFSQSPKVWKIVPENEMQALYEGGGVLHGMIRMIHTPPVQQLTLLATETENYREWMRQCLRYFVD